MKDKGHRGATVDKSKPTVGKVEKIEVNERHIPLRLVLLIVFILIGITAFGIFFSTLLNAEPGWMVIEEANTNYPSIGQDFILNYYVPKTNSTASKKKVVSIYSELVEKSFLLFNELNEYEGYNNVYYINHHPNEEIEIDSVLYNAFKKINDHNNKIIFLAPVYQQYRNLFSSESNTYAKEFDPKYNEDMKDYFLEICEFVNSDKVSISLLENNKIKLNVSDDYLEYTKANEIDEYINFWTLKNAFVCDYMATTLYENGITGFVLSSNDGYNYSVGSPEELSLEVWRKDGKKKIMVGRLSFTGTSQFVTYTDSPLDINKNDYYEYYESDDKSKDLIDVTSRYISEVDGISREGTSAYYAYGSTIGCAEIAMEVLNIFISDSIDQTKVDEIKNMGIYSLYLDTNNNIVSNLSDAVSFKSYDEIYGDN